MKICISLRYVKVDIEKKTALNSLTTLRESLLTTEQKMCQLEADLKIEREWRTRLQTLSEADKEALYQQKVEMTRLQTKANVTIFLFSSVTNTIFMPCLLYLAQACLGRSKRTENIVKIQSQYCQYTKILLAKFSRLQFEYKMYLKMKCLEVNFYVNM